MSRENRIFAMVIGFLIVGSLVVVSTHSQEYEYTTEEKPEVLSPLISSKDYYITVSPWLRSAHNDSSLESIQIVRNNLLNFRSPDKELGEVHVSLFLAFDAWEDWLVTKQDVYRQQALERFDRVKVLMPDLAGDVEKLKNTLNNA